MFLVSPLISKVRFISQSVNIDYLLLNYGVDNRDLIINIWFYCLTELMVEADDNSDDDYSTIFTESLDVNDFCPNVTSTAERPSIASFGRHPLRRADTPIPLTMTDRKVDEVAEGVLEENVLDADNRG